MSIYEYNEEYAKKANFEAGEEAGYAKGEEAGYVKGEEAGYAKGEEAGYVRGRDEGFDEGQEYTLARVNQLIRILSEQNRLDDITRAANDKVYQEKLFKEFGI